MNYECDNPLSAQLPKRVPLSCTSNIQSTEQALICDLQDCALDKQGDKINILCSRMGCDVQCPMTKFNNCEEKNQSTTYDLQLSTVGAGGDKCRSGFLQYAQDTMSKTDNASTKLYNDRILRDAVTAIMEQHLADVYAAYKENRIASYSLSPEIASFYSNGIDEVVRTLQGDTTQSNAIIRKIIQDFIQNKSVDKLVSLLLRYHTTLSLLETSYLDSLQRQRILLQRLLESFSQAMDEFWTAQTQGKKNALQPFPIEEFYKVHSCLTILIRKLEGQPTAGQEVGTLEKLKFQKLIPMAGSEKNLCMLLKDTIGYTTDCK